MKKFFSILFASLILLSGLHLSVASHICCGELAAVKYSFTGAKATCGMEDDQGSVPSNGKVKGICCENKVTSCSTDNNYFPSSNIVKDIAKEIAPLFNLLPNPAIPAPAVNKAILSMVGPPVNYSFRSVDLSFICVFTC